ncbi:endonuclease/exonuclease/phosphatase family protein [Candidatus Berkiella cookevillensis]|uniref:Endonuclease/exonuclease/phosphatase family protein n=1 Tax=Candidatus Berkiella cookevillensis TaxID=437022 RepID=A0A0Q9YKQ1_9GAMM|nr:endonuclease/exonuclease/phosphatase family protein [Candidatus Berkiella cookevillensis]MCS5709141.1 endonuclease/exonuclease/phosphatase family protein [Candidatus Berkiella cookevillensis]
MGKDTIPYEIKTKPLFTHALKPVKFIKSWLSWFGNWKSASSPPIKLPSPEQLKVLSYNLWGAPQDAKNPYFQFKQRSQAVLKLISTIDADVICLQEVSRDWADKLLADPFIRKNFYSTDFNTDRVHSYFGLSQITLSKFPIISATAYGLPGYEIYSLLNTQIQFGTQTISVNNVHLHSGKEHSSFRIAQLETIFNILTSQEQSDSTLIAGDFNFGDNWDENSVLDSAPMPLTDIWKHLKDNDPGYTEDSHINIMRFNLKGCHKQERFDRILVQSNTMDATDIKLIGQAPIDPDAQIWPSDHFGLLARFDIHSRKEVISSNSSSSKSR